MKVKAQGWLHKFACTIVIIAASFTNATISHADQTLSWATNDLIPFYIKEGPFKGQGISDKLTSFFALHLPGYKHQQIDMTFPRFFAQAESGDLVCNPLLLKTPKREQKLLYSQPFKPAYAHVLISPHPIDYPEGGLSLADFIKTEKHGLIVQKQRSYGSELDKIIRAGIKSGHVQEENFSTQQLFAMLEHGRMAHFLDIENAVTYQNKQRKGIKRFYNIPLREDRLDRFGYVACTKNAEGAKLIEAINKILKEKADDPEFRLILESWMAAENLPRFRTFYESVILKK